MIRSLRGRAILGGAFWALISIVAGGFTLLIFLNAVADNRFNGLLSERHLQVIVALEKSGGDPEGMNGLLFDPEYNRPYSGRYWQIEAENGDIVTSWSLFDQVLVAGNRVTGSPQIWTGNGPKGPVRGLAQQITLEDGSIWTVRVASSLAALNAERQLVKRNLFVALGFIGVLGMVGAMLLTSAILVPLARLRKDVAHRWDEGEELKVETYPEEVALLVSDINELLQRNREIVDRARRQAADLAHALKTPSAALRNELEGDFRNRRAVEALDRIDAQISRSLARVRAANSAGSVRLRTDLTRSVNRISRLFHSLPCRGDKSLQVRIKEDLRVVMDAQDIEEILGNMLENAFKWCSSAVTLSVSRSADFAIVRIEDDGPGIPEQQQRQALSPGGRLDTSVPGTVLGLAIACDLAHAYGGAIDLSASGPLGGLCVTISIPLRALPAQSDAPETRLAKAS